MRLPEYIGQVCIVGWTAHIVTDITTEGFYTKSQADESVWFCKGFGHTPVRAEKSRAVFGVKKAA